MPKFIVTYRAVVPFLVGAVARILPETNRVSLLPWLAGHHPDIPGIDTKQKVVISDIKALSLSTPFNQETPFFCIRLELAGPAEYKVDTFDIPSAVLTLGAQVLSQQAPILEIIEPLTWIKSEPTLVPAPHVVTLKSEPKRRHILEKEARYVVSVNGAEYGELYYNMRGYRGGLPLPNGHELDIGEKGISAFKKEIAVINREAREVLAYATARGRYVEPRV
jgi:hypothetical protein